MPQERSFLRIAPWSRGPRNSVLLSNLAFEEKRSSPQPARHCATKAFAWRTSERICVPEPDTRAESDRYDKLRKKWDASGAGIRAASLIKTPCLRLSKLSPLGLGYIGIATLLRQNAQFHGRFLPDLDRSTRAVLFFLEPGLAPPPSTRAVRFNPARRASLHDCEGADSIYVVFERSESARRRSSIFRSRRVGTRGNRVRTFYTEEHSKRNARSELSGGALVSPHECPQRATIIRDRLLARGFGDIAQPEAYGLTPILRVHDENFVRFLETAWDEWRATGASAEAIPINWPARPWAATPPELILGKWAITHWPPIRRSAREHGSRPAPPSMSV